MRRPRDEVIFVAVSCGRREDHPVAAARPSSRTPGPHRILRLVPDGARVAVGNSLAPRLTDRCDVVLFPNADHVPVDRVVVDTTCMSGVPAPREQQEAALAWLSSDGFQRINQIDGIVLFRHV